MINQYFVIIGALLILTGSFSYISDTIKGKIKPNKVTWLFWSFAPSIAFAAELKQGAGIISLMTFMVGFVPFLIFLVSFINKKSQWKLGIFDLLCAILSLTGLIIWYISKEPNIGILFSILADAAAGLPTIVKSYYAPETENYVIFLLGLISAIITLLTVKTWTLSQYGFPLYICIINLILVLLIWGKLGKYVKAYYSKKL